MLAATQLFPARCRRNNAGRLDAQSFLYLVFFSIFIEYWNECVQFQFSSCSGSAKVLVLFSNFVLSDYCSDLIFLRLSFKECCLQTLLVFIGWIGTRSNVIRHLNARCLSKCLKSIVWSNQCNDIIIETVMQPVNVWFDCFS